MLFRSSANLVVAQMLFLQFDDPKADIHLYINSPGGSVTAGMGIFDTMRYITCDVATYCIGMAASMGAMVFVVVVVGGLGSLGGAFLASLLIGLLQTAALAVDVPVLPGVTLARLAPVLPFACMLLMLVLRPQGLLGRP